MKRNRTALHNKKKEGQICKYSDSCFTCPLSDCKVSQSIISQINVLPSEADFYKDGNERGKDTK